MSASGLKNVEREKEQGEKKERELTSQQFHKEPIFQVG
jgi:hypothetical protein